MLFRHYQIKLALVYLLAFFQEYGHESRVILIRFCEKIGGLSVISSLPNQTCTSIFSYFLYFLCFQSKFTTVYLLILLIVQK